MYWKGHLAELPSSVIIIYSYFSQFLKHTSDFGISDKFTVFS